MKTLKNLHMGALGTLVAVAALAGCNRGPDTATSESTAPPAATTDSGTTTSPGTSGYVGPGSSTESELQRSPNSTAGAAGPTGGSDLTAPGTTESSSPGGTGTMSEEEMRNRSGTSGSGGSGTSGAMGPNSSLSTAERQFRDLAAADNIEKQLAAWRERYGVKLVQVEDRQGDASMSGSGSSGMGMTQNNPDKPAAQQISRSDRKFIEKAAVDGMFEVEAARLAEQKASDPQVKSFAAKLMQQHQQANDELKQIADARGVTLPTQLPSKEQRKIDGLAKQSGQKFDEAFLKTAGRKDHQKDIKDFEKARRDTKDPDLQAWIDKTLPTLRTHLAEAQSMTDKSGKMQGYTGEAPSPSGTSGGGSMGSGNP